LTGVRLAESARSERTAYPSTPLEIELAPPRWQGLAACRPFTDFVEKVSHPADLDCRDIHIKGPGRLDAFKLFISALRAPKGPISVPVGKQQQGLIRHDQIRTSPGEIRAAPTMTHP
jgi:hypothetical protein